MNRKNVNEPIKIPHGRPCRRWLRSRRRPTAKTRPPTRKSIRRRVDRKYLGKLQHVLRDLNDAERTAGRTEQTTIAMPWQPKKRWARFAADWSGEPL